MAFLFSSPQFTQSGTDTDLTDSGLVFDADTQIVLESNPLHRTTHLDGKWIQVDGALSWDGDVDTLVMEGWTNTIIYNNTIWVSSTGDLTMGTKTIDGDKVRYSAGIHLILISNDTTANDEYGGSNSEYSGIAKIDGGNLTFYGGVVISDETISFSNNDQITTLDSGDIVIEGTKFMRIGSEIRELRFDKDLTSLYGSGSRIVGMVVDGGYNLTHRALPEPSSFVLLDGSLNQLSLGPNHTIVRLLDTANNLQAFDLGYDANNTDGLGTSAKTYEIHGTSSGSNIRALVKDNINNSQSRRFGIMEIICAILVPVTDTSGTTILDVARFIRDTDNGERKNLNSQDDTADKTHYWTTEIQQDVITGIGNRDDTDNQVVFDGPNSLDMRGKSHSIDSISVTDQSGLTANLITPDQVFVDMRENDYFQLANMGDADNNGTWQANENYGATTFGEIGCSKTSTDPVNETLANGVTLVKHGEDRFDIHLVRREYLLRTITDINLRGLFDSDNPLTLSTILLDDPNWSNSNSGDVMMLGFFMNLDEVYDAGKQWQEAEANIEYPSAGVQVLPLVGTNLDASANNLTVIITDIEQTNPFEIDQGTDVLTIEAHAITGLAPGTKVLGITVGATEEVEIQNGAVIDGIAISGDLVLDIAQDLTDVTVTGNMGFNVGGTVTFSNVSVSGDILNDDASSPLTINGTDGSVLSTTEPGTGNGEVNLLFPVTVSINAKDAATNTNVENARVSLEADSGGDLPALENVDTITRSGTLAMVTHTAHNVPDGSRIIIRGANEPEYNGSHLIIVASANVYTYNVDPTPASPATGTITVTSQILDGSTDALGIVEDTAFNYTADQPVIGRVRKGTAAPFYKTSFLAGTISSSGLAITTFLVGDD